MRAFLVIFAMLLTLPVNAANKYLRAGASGANNGNNWTDAYTSLATLESNLARGDTGYVADGSYGSATFNTAASGTTVITIKKATIADHGTDTGWSDAFGDGQADINSTLTFNTGYWTVDGSTRGSDWFDGTAYGFKINHNNQDQQIVITDPGQSVALPNMRFTNIYLAAIVGNLPGTTIRRYAIDTDNYGGALSTGHVFSKLFVEGSNNPFFVRGSSAPVIEYCASLDVSGNSANHGENVNLYFNPANAVVRYCYFKNCFTDGGGGGTAVIAIQDTNGHELYGNIVDNYQCGDAVFGFIGGNASNMKIYNNTFVKSTSGGGGVQASAGSGNAVRNNLWVGVNDNDVNVGGSATVTHNAYSTSSGSGTSTQLNVPTSIFVSYAGGNYHLASATTAGVTLSSPYNVDLDGVTRGGDGTWDRGAMEFVAGTPPTFVQAPAGLRVRTR